jgi:acyl-CoA dehydrogenase
MNVCNYSEVMDICGLSISRMYVDNRIARIYAGTNEIMKIVIARGLFKDLLRKGKKF